MAISPVLLLRVTRGEKVWGDNADSREDPSKDDSSQIPRRSQLLRVKSRAPLSTNSEDSAWLEI